MLFSFLKEGLLYTLYVRICPYEIKHLNSPPQKTKHLQAECRHSQPLLKATLQASKMPAFLSGLLMVMVNRIITAKEEEELSKYVKQRLSRTR